MKTNYEVFTSDIDKLAQLLEDNSQSGYPAWMEWFDENYCSACDTIEIMDNGRVIKDNPCYIYGHKCPYHPNLDHPPVDQDIIKIWLMSDPEECIPVALRADFNPPDIDEFITDTHTNREKIDRMDYLESILDMSEELFWWEYEN